MNKHGARRFDYLLWGSFVSITILYGLHWLTPQDIAGVAWLHILSESVHKLINTIYWGVAIGFLMISVLSKVPREFVISILGRHGGLDGILRAAVGGILLDLCSHGILMVGAKLYERGAGIGQVMAFLVASPWNSFSLTLVLIALIGVPWTLAFTVLSMIIAILTGLVFEKLVASEVLPSNPKRIDLPADFRFWKEARKGLASTRFTPRFLGEMLHAGLLESRLVVRWILFGVLLAGLIRAFVPPDQFQTFFGPTLAGLGLTVLVATILEVCSEGSTPVAADLLTRAKAPGNSFAFLMTGVATDYTEIMILRDTTRSWKIALFLPLLTLPQVILIAWAMNAISL